LAGCQEKWWSIWRLHFGASHRNYEKNIFMKICCRKMMIGKMLFYAQIKT